MMSVKQYVPEFYERDYGRSNVVTHSAEVLEQILTDIETEPFNNWNDRETINNEFHIKEIIVSGFAIRDTSFLKAFFAFKGTNLDLKYILNNIGYESVIYNDGGYLHRNIDGTERVIPINPFYGDKLSEPRCQIEIKVIIDLNRDETYEGYSGIDLARIKGICQERLNSCSYLSRVFIEISAKEIYETMKWTTDYCTVKRIFPAMTDEYFEEYTLPEVVYGKEYNDSLRYGKEFNDSLPYGSHKQIYFKPIGDKLITGRVSQMPESAMAINGQGDATIQASDFMTVVVSKPHYDTYRFAMQDYLTIAKHSVVWLTDEAPYPTLEAQDSFKVGYGRRYGFIENPNAYYYGREHNLNLRYGVGRGADEFGTEDAEVIAYGDKPKNQGTENQVLGLNGSDDNAVINLQDSLQIVVKSKKS